MKKLEFKSKILDDELKTQIYLAYDEKFFYNNRIINNEKDQSVRVIVKSEPCLCINFSDLEIKYEIEENLNVKLHGIGIENDIIIHEDEYILMDDKDKEELDSFLQKTEDFLNNTYLNKKFDNKHYFNSYHKQKHKERRYFVQKVKEKSWKKELFYSIASEDQLSITEIFKVSKGDKEFLCFLYGTLTDYEYVIKYNNDIKEEVESMFYEKEENLYVYLIPVFFVLLIICIKIYYVFFQ